MAETHPSCPYPAVLEILDRMDGRIWDPPVTLGGAVGISMDGYVRHQLTNYEKLLSKAGLSREDAREQVQPRINEIIASWQRPQEA